jgi:hypothetical protein
MGSSEISELLTKEQEEINTWNRTTIQIYFGWYSVFLTVKGAGLAWLFQYEARTKPGSHLVFMVFALFNFLGLIVSGGVSKYIKDSDARLEAIYSYLSKSTDVTFMPKSGLPRTVARTSVLVVSIAMTTLCATWLWFGIS